MDGHVTELTNMVLSVSYFKVNWDIEDGTYLLSTAIEYYLDDLNCYAQHAVEYDSHCEGIIISSRYGGVNGRLFIMDGVKGAGLMTQHSLLWFSVNDWVFFDNDEFNEFHAPDCPHPYVKGYTRNAFADFLTRGLRPQTIHIKSNEDSGLVFDKGHQSWSYVDFTNALSFDNPEIQDVERIAIYNDNTIHYLRDPNSPWERFSLK